MARSTASMWTGHRSTGSWKVYMTDYVDFHSRSAFSFLEAASLPEDLVQRASELGHSAMALMDRDNLCGAPRFYMAAKKIGAKAHLGAEITGEDGGRYP